MSEEKTKVSEKERQVVIIQGIDMPFASIVGFMVKWSIASIPALIILAFLGWIATAFIASFFMF